MVTEQGRRCTVNEATLAELRDAWERYVEAPQGSDESIEAFFEVDAFLNDFN
jgi:hypothetical protein